MSGTSVGDDRKGKGALPPLTPPYKGGEAAGRDTLLTMRRKPSARSNHQTFLPGLRPSGVPLVAVIGRPNVGKSTLFNRILGTRNAIVDDRPGVTRDRIYAECTYQGRRFQVVDTGGLDPTSTEGMLGLIRQQSQVALATADILLVIMDGRAGLTPLDQEIVNGLHGVDKPTFWVINKIDSPTLDPLLADFYHLGKDTLFPISAEHGTGVDELLEAFLHLLPELDQDLEETATTRVAVVGRPNVGKSTLVNTILGEERVLVSDVPGTTRDPIDTHLEREDRQFLLTDTAGLRRRGRVEPGIEGYSVARTMKALGRSDIGVLLLDGVEGVTDQDTKIAGLIQRQGRGCVMLVNKWDLRRAQPEAKKKFSLELQRQFPFFTFVPILFGSALAPKTVDHLFDAVTRVMDAFSYRVPTSRLNQFLQKALADNPIPTKKGNPLKSLFITQVSTKPPTFALFAGKSVVINSAYLRYLENQLRATFGFEGTPLRILVRKKN